MLAGMDALGKYLQQTLPTMQVVWGRFFFHALILAVLLSVMSHRRQHCRPRRLGLQLLRSALLLGVTLFLYTAIRSGSLADATAILFFAPVLVTVLAGVLLHEPIDARKWIAVAMGFVGVLVLVRPGLMGFQPSQLYALVAALSLAGYFVLTRYLHAHDSEWSTIIYTPVVGTLVTSLVMLFVWHTPTTVELLLLTVMGLIGGSGHFLLIWAFHRASASALSPLLNSQLLVAAFYSAWLFNDRLELWFYIGSALIIGAGLLVSARKRSALSSG